MKVPYSWLADWVDVPWEARELGSRLTMSGFELDALEPAAPAFTQVVVAEIVSAERHPQADKLQVCRVSTGQGSELLQIVCGAPNARAGLKTALAMVGASLPGGLEIKAAKLRGAESAGMLCSAKELGLSDSSAGIIEFSADAPLGRPVQDYLELDDTVLELNITANRGDAMSIIGIAREVAALAGKKLKEQPSSAVTGSTSNDRFPVFLDAPAACPTFVGCVIRGVNNRATTPLRIRERLRRAGVRSISPVVDVTNYVMLELGQPMHAYDLAKLKGEIRVRLARAGEQITLLDGKTIEASPDVLFITDQEGPVGLAGIMGGQRTAVSAETTDVFFEVAFFTPQAITGRARRWGLLTDAVQRYERGIDPTQQRRAIERALGLLTSIAGGSPGPVVVTQSAEHQPKRAPVRLRRSRLERLLGASIPDDRVKGTLEALQMRVVPTSEGWEATPPPYRFDITIEADLIEEVARIVGFESIPERDALVPQQFRAAPEEIPLEHTILETLANRGYQEAITYAFVDPALQTKLFPDRPGLALSNPIASDMSVMRVSLWPGLLRAALENQRRQQDRIRLFEHGARFVVTAGGTHEVDTLAGVACGARLPEQWGVPRDMRGPADFYDVKGDLEALLIATGAEKSFVFEPAALSCLHPGRAARILRDGREVGVIGELHPSLVRELDFTYSPVLFELDLGGTVSGSVVQSSAQAQQSGAQGDFAEALAVQKPQHSEISRFPQVRRDIAVVVDESVALSALADRVLSNASTLLHNLRVFDVYRGTGIETGRKSIALGLIFQDISRTLTDDDVDRLMASIVADLRESLNAKIRE
ncbi:MAG: phenylalanine tRNA synthetase, beta-subunit [Gammaproteobacteria bacterium]|nr:phenylalanine tRNA synthetase, beta-subunit [Gammaproteobacteria bacterium]